MSILSRTWLRRITGASIGVLLAVVLGLAVYRARPFSTPMLGFETEESGAGNGEAVGVYKGFEYLESVAGELVFGLSSIKTLGFASGWHEIEGVRLQLYNRGVKGPVLTCERASFNRQTRDARLSGTIHLAFADGGFLSTEAGHFDAASRRLLTDDAVVFSGHGILGHAGRAVYALQTDRLILDRGTVVQTAGGDWLAAPEVVYQREMQRAVMQSGCRVEYGPFALSAPRAVVELEARDGAPRRIELAGGVHFEAGRAPGGGTAAGEAARLVAERDATDRWQVRGIAGDDRVRVVLSGGTDYYQRSLEAWALRSVVAPDGILNLRAEQGVCLDDVPFEGPPRRAEARTATVWFEGRTATDVELEDKVVVAGGGLVATGYRARIAGGPGVVMLHGDPEGVHRTVLVSEQGRVACDQAQLYEREGRTEARGNVQGRLDDVVLLGREGDGEPAPVYFAAGVLDVTGEGSVFELRGAARAWQEHRLLLADKLVYRAGDESLEATGHVRTTLPADQLDPATGEGGEDVVVVARSLDYSRGERRAVYRGNVTYTDSRRILSSTELTAVFDEHDAVTSLEAVGAVELIDTESGRRVTAERAERQVASQVVVLTGSPVRMSESNGTVVQASSLTWDQASGTVTVAGDTETVYYPEEKP